ncbi:MAG: hypothetical protein M4D80_09070 [Myxococcota bacterium]|nr:hypothetical protein [Myxococcota bacterium]
MSCAPLAEQIDPVHASECLVCKRALVEQRALLAQLATLPVPRLDRERRQTLAAEVMARADLRDDTQALPRRRVGRYVAGALAAAALIALLLREERSQVGARVTANVKRVEQVRSDRDVRIPTDVAPPRPEVAPRVEPARDVEVAGGTIDPPAPPASAPKLDRARQVFGSTAKRANASIDRDTLVEQSPVAAFRAGWEALREARYADAIAAFDRATDPAVAEDAVFWAAIAAQRAGHTDDARKRLDLFLATFPESPRAESARRAREVLR